MYFYTDIKNQASCTPFVSFVHFVVEIPEEQLNSMNVEHD